MITVRFCTHVYGSSLHCVIVTVALEWVAQVSLTISPGFLTFCAFSSSITNVSSYSQWYSSGSDVNMVMAGMSNDGLVTVDGGGCVRLWETAVYFLQKSMEQWRSLIGEGDHKPLEVQHMYFCKSIVLSRSAKIGIFGGLLFGQSEKQTNRPHHTWLWVCCFYYCTKQRIFLLTFVWNIALLQISFGKEIQRQAEIGAPKHGRIDPTGAPHVGGNQWAGGTGRSWGSVVMLKGHPPQVSYYVTAFAWGSFAKLVYKCFSRNTKIILSMLKEDQSFDTLGYLFCRWDQYSWYGRHGWALPPGPWQWSLSDSTVGQRCFAWGGQTQTQGVSTLVSRLCNICCTVWMQKYTVIVSVAVFSGEESSQRNGLESLERKVRIITVFGEAENSGCDLDVVECSRKESLHLAS